MPHGTTDCVICGVPDDGWGHPNDCEGCGAPMCHRCWQNHDFCEECEKENKEYDND